MSINIVCISGNLTRDPMLSATPGGTSVLNISMAVNDRRKNSSGEWEDYPNFVDCVLFGNRAEALSNVLRKGKLVTVQGRLRYQSWERDGQKRSKISVLVDEISFQSEKRTSATPAPAPYQESGYHAPDLYDEEVPF